MVRAETYPDTNPVTGRSRRKCSVCRKVVYPSAREAWDAAYRISDRVPMKAYYKQKCGWFHVARKRRVRR